ncbi:MAG TPA: HEAT repeat domain-containing protein [Isosphaeraceae bacterium]|nr:HEAT repeat domain-containing protein [Isosphaeraceae bacterium]
MNSRTVRFRCPRCQACHSAAATRIGSHFVCKTCFGALIVPEGLANAIALAKLAEVAEPTPAVPDVVEVVVPEAVEEAVVEQGQFEEDADEVIEEPLSEEAVEAGEVVDRPAGPRRRWALVAAVGAVAALGLLAVGLRGRGRNVANTQVAAVPDHQQPAPLPHELREASAKAATTTPDEIKPPATIPDSAALDEVTPAPPIEVATAPDRPQVKLEPIKPAAPRPAPPIERKARRKGEIVRRQMRDQDALRRELLEVPELGLRPATAAAVLKFNGTEMTQNINPAFAGFPFGNEAKGPTRRHNSAATFNLVRRQQRELADLSWRLGDECRIGKEPAEDLQDLSRALRNLLQDAIPAGNARPDAAALRRTLIAGVEPAEPAPAAFRRVPGRFPGRSAPAVDPEDWRRPAAIPALMQLLMAEGTSVREVLVDVLDTIPGEAASTALARLATFDLSPEVRERAIRALVDRPAEQARSTLLAGLRYPWPPAADHAAEALVALDDRGAIADLEHLLDQPDPLAPASKTRYGSTRTVVPTLVRLSHLRNCLLCHAPSPDPTTDLVRGKVPIPGQPLPPPRQYYGDMAPGYFVRADITYIRQDFSVAQPVDGAEPWPSYQRFDYLIAEVPADRRRGPGKEKAEMPASYPQRESVLFALRYLRDDPPRAE